MKATATCPDCKATCSYTFTDRFDVFTAALKALRSIDHAPECPRNRTQSCLVCQRPTGNPDAICDQCLYQADKAERQHDAQPERKAESA